MKVQSRPQFLKPYEPGVLDRQVEEKRKRFKLFSCAVQLAKKPARLKKAEEIEIEIENRLLFLVDLARA